MQGSQSSSNQSSKGGKRPVVIVTSLSGAGMSSVLKILEDLGYEVFDNFPLTMTGPLIAEDDFQDHPIALGVDVRSRGFSPQAVADIVSALRENSRYDVKHIFLNCSDKVLEKRFSETRRRHPLAKDRPVIDGIIHERNMLKPLLDACDYPLNTTELGLTDLRQLIQQDFALDEGQSRLSVTVMSFGFKNGLPRQADMVLDVRFLRNPHWDEELREYTGAHEGVQNYIKQDPYYDDFYVKTLELLKLLIPRYQHEGKRYFTLALGCMGGKHRSVFIAEELAREVSECAQVDVSVKHRELQE